MEITQEELQNARHLVGASTTLCAKVTYYSNSNTDENVKEVLGDICTACTNVKDYFSQNL